MKLHVADTLIIVAYLVGVTVLGVFLAKRVKTEKDYFLGGRSLPFWAIGLSIVGSDIGATDFVGLVGATYRYGLVAANMDWIGSMPALLLAAFVFVPYYWRAGVYSVPEYLGRRYNGSVRAIQGLAWTVFLAVNLGVTFWATALLLEEVLGWSKSFSIPLVAAITGFYTISGGLAAVVFTDVIQVCLMFLGGLLVVVLGVIELGGVESMYQAIIAEHPDHFSLYLPHDTKTPYPWTGILLGLTFVLAPAYFIANQAIVQRTLGAKDEWSAKASALFACLFKFAIPFVVVAPGLVALALYPDLSQTSITDPDKVFALLVQDLLPIGVRGIVFAAFLGGLMSSVDSALNSASTLITQDLYVGLFHGAPDDRKLLRIGRWVTLCLVIVGAATAPLSMQFEGVYTAIQTFLSVIQGPTFGILLPAMFWRRATGLGGLVSLVFGFGFALFLTVFQKYAKVWGFEPLFASEDPFFFIAFISFAATLIVNIIVSLLSRPRPPEELRGLVYRWIDDDDGAQEALAGRSGPEGGD